MKGKKGVFLARNISSGSQVFYVVTVRTCSLSLADRNLPTEVPTTTVMRDHDLFRDQHVSSL
ncbi:hypothetical protein L484_016269 [Morus notabilis]|uniref:Uncharacterized protein n=1 Tax=Morus notabilis TaxID=981085 RepID=W9QSU7_9ROSA|nr:hypothetical protein L484_016269 [Morus notabilis]